MMRGLYLPKSSVSPVLRVFAPGVFFFAFFVSSTLLAQEEVELNPLDPEKIFEKKTAATHEFHEKPEKVNAQAYKMFKAIGGPLRELCEELYWDAHLTNFQLVIQELRKSVQFRCEDCKLLLKALGASCRVSPVKMNKEREARLARRGIPVPSPSESPLQAASQAAPQGSAQDRPHASSDASPSASPSPSPSPIIGAAYDPSAPAIDAAVRTFLPLAETAGADEIALLTLEKMLERLQEWKLSDAREREYFDSLFTYIFSCFDEVYEKRRRKDAEAFQKSLPTDPFLRREKILERQGRQTRDSLSESGEHEELFDF